VAKTEGEKINFEEPIFTEEMATPIEPAAAVASVSESVAVEAEPEKAKSKKSKDPKDKKKGSKAREAASEWAAEEAARKRKGAMLYLVLSFLMLVPIVFVGLAHFKFLEYPIAVFLCGIVLIPCLIWLSRKTSTVYTMFLALTTVALLGSVCFLWAEISRYNYDIHASGAKGTATAQP
jgi:hypothetical protein